MKRLESVSRQKHKKNGKIFRATGNWISHTDDEFIIILILFFHWLFYFFYSFLHFLFSRYWRGCSYCCGGIYISGGMGIHVAYEALKTWKPASTNSFWLSEMQVWSHNLNGLVSERLCMGCFVWGLIRFSLCFFFVDFQASQILKKLEKKNSHPFVSCSFVCLSGKKSNMME